MTNLVVSMDMFVISTNIEIFQGFVSSAHSFISPRITLFKNKQQSKFQVIKGMRASYAVYKLKTDTLAE